MWLTRYYSQKGDPHGDQGFTELEPSLYSKAAAGSALSVAISAEALTIVGRWPERVD